MVERTSVIEYVNDFLRSCQTLSVRIDKAIVFGSAVDGTYNLDSDIDVALFSPDFTDNILDNLGLVAKAVIAYPEIELHTYPSKQYYLNGLLLDEVKRTGIELPL